MFCPKCGSEVPNDAEFCPKCDTKLTMDTPAQGQQVNMTAIRPKKKSKKWVIIVTAIAALILILFVAFFDQIIERGERAQRDQEYINAHQEAMQMEKESGSPSEMESMP